MTAAILVQGLEKPIIILSTAVTRVGGFVADPHRLNVAFTRAKHHLILVRLTACMPSCDRHMMCKYPIYDVINDSSDVSVNGNSMPECHSVGRMRVDAPVSACNNDCAHAYAPNTALLLLAGRPCACSGGHSACLQGSAVCRQRGAWGMPEVLPWQGADMLGPGCTPRDVMF